VAGALWAAGAARRFSTTLVVAAGVRAVPNYTDIRLKRPPGWNYGHTLRQRASNVTTTSATATIQALTATSGVSR